MPTEFIDGRLPASLGQSSRNSVGAIILIVFEITSLIFEYIIRNTTASAYFGGIFITTILITFIIFLVSYSRMQSIETRPKIAVILFILCTIVSIIFTYAIIMERYGIASNGNCIEGDLSERVYFSVVTFTTLGYGDFTPCINVGRTVAASEALVGYFILGLFVSTISAIFRPSDDLIPGVDIAIARELVKLRRDEIVSDELINTLRKTLNNQKESGR